MKPEDVVRLREAVNLVANFALYPAEKLLADHVAAELKHYDHDGKPLPVDREWLLQVGGEPHNDIAATDFYCEACIGMVRVWNDGRVSHNGMIIDHLTNFTRPRFLALLAGLGIQHKEHSDAP